MVARSPYSRGVRFQCLKHCYDEGEMALNVSVADIAERKWMNEPHGRAHIDGCASSGHITTPASPSSCSLAHTNTNISDSELSPKTIRSE